MRPCILAGNTYNLLFIMIIILPTLKSRLRKHWFPPDWADRIQLWTAHLLQLAILGVLIGTLTEGRWLVAFTAAGTLSLTFLPALIDRRLHVHLPIEFTFVTCLFLYAAFGLGEVRRFYDRFWWWDILLHSFSALVIGLIGFLLVYVFYSTHRIRMAPIYVAVVSFGLAVTVGVIWEIFEYVMDLAFDLNMQKSGLPDTMMDLAMNALGGLVAAWIGYHYVKNGDSLIADRLVRRLVARNPRLFQHRGPSRRRVQ